MQAFFWCFLVPCGAVVSLSATPRDRGGGRAGHNSAPVKLSRRSPARRF